MDAQQILYFLLEKIQIEKWLKYCIINKQIILIFNRNLGRGCSYIMDGVKWNLAILFLITNLRKRKCWNKNCSSIKFVQIHDNLNLICRRKPVCGCSHLLHISRPNIEVKCCSCVCVAQNVLYALDIGSVSQEQAGTGMA